MTVALRPLDGVPPLVLVLCATTAAVRQVLLLVAYLVALRRAEKEDVPEIGAYAQAVRSWRPTARDRPAVGSPSPGREP